jgi:hypothetical protein
VPRSILALSPGRRELAATRLPTAVARSRTQLVWRAERRSSALEALRALL